MRKSHNTHEESAIKIDSLHSVNSLSTDTLRATPTTRNCQKAAMSNPLIKLLLPLVMVFVLGIAGTAILKADGQDEEGYIHKPKLVLWEEYYREWLDTEHQRMYGRPWDPNNPGDPKFFWNPDSVMVDVNWGACEGWYSPEAVEPPVRELPLWFKYGPMLHFDHNLIPRKEIYEDNRVIKYTIDDILPQYKETIEGFKELEKIIGKFHFEDRFTMYPDTAEYIPDVQAASPRSLFIVFDNYTFNSEHGYWLRLECSKWGLVDIECALGNIKFVQRPGVFLNLNGHNNIFMDGGYDDIREYIQPLFVSPAITSDNITLSLPEILTIFPKSIQIVDSTGKMVKLFYTGIDTQQIIDVSDLPAGRYFVQIDNYVGSFIVR